MAFIFFINIYMNIPQDRQMDQNNPSSSVYIAQSNLGAKPQLLFKPTILPNDQPSPKNYMNRQKITGLDLFKEKLKYKQEIYKLSEKVKALSDRVKQLDAILQFQKQQHKRLLVQNQNLKHTIQELKNSMEGPRQSQIVSDKSKDLSRQSQKKSRSLLSLSKYILPNKQKQVSNDNLSVLIEKTVKSLNKQNKSTAQIQLMYKQAEENLAKAREQIQVKTDKNIQQYQTLAFIYSNLVSIKCEQQKDLSQIEQTGRKALNIYNSNQGVYFEEKIVLLNNIGLYLQKQGKLASAIELYKQIQAIQQKYYSIHDERRLLILNNIACTYCQNKMMNEGLNYFNKCKGLIVEDGELSKLVQQNIEYYQKFMPAPSQSIPYDSSQFANWFLKQSKYKD